MNDLKHADMEERLAQSLGAYADAAGTSSTPANELRVRGMRAQRRRTRTRLISGISVLTVLVAGTTTAVIMQSGTTESTQTVAVADPRLERDPNFRLFLDLSARGFATEILDVNGWTTPFPYPDADNPEAGYQVVFKGSQGTISIKTSVDFGCCPGDLTRATQFEKAKAKGQRRFRFYLQRLPDRPIGTSTEMDGTVRPAIEMPAYLAVEIEAPDIDLAHEVSKSVSLASGSLTHLDSVPPPNGFREVFRGDRRELAPTMQLHQGGAFSAFSLWALLPSPREIELFGMPEGPGDPMTVRGLPARITGEPGGYTVSWWERGWHFYLRTDSIESASAFASDLQEVSLDRYQALVLDSQIAAKRQRFEQQNPPVVVESDLPAYQIVTTINERGCIELRLVVDEQSTEADLGCEAEISLQSKPNAVVSKGGRRFALIATTERIDGVIVGGPTGPQSFSPPDELVVPAVSMLGDKQQIALTTAVVELDGDKPIELYRSVTAEADSNPGVGLSPDDEDVGGDTNESETEPTKLVHVHTVRIDS
jgi:hypothetical protein